tara:strand:+ start:95 stop:334 length:240 start_codon:yes stop_codon:yes gene_type:complete
MKQIDYQLEQWIKNGIVRAEVRKTIVNTMKDIKYRVWLGGILLDIDGREKLTLNEAIGLVKDWTSLGYEDVNIEQHINE